MKTYTTIRTVDEITDEIEVPVSWGNHRLFVGRRQGVSMEQCCEEAAAEVVGFFGPPVVATNPA
jgi:hypothetical protein